jgi:hypothetical protein
MRNDLGISDGDWVRQIARLGILEAFVEQRSHVADGAERVASLTDLTSRPVFTLHRGRSRAGTWHDRTNGIVWLLGVHLDAHDYEHLATLQQRRLLFPTDHDVERERFGEDRELARALIEDAAALVAAAENRRGELIEATIAGVVDVRLSCEEGMEAILVVAVSHRLRQAFPIPDVEPGEASWLFVIASAFFPEIPITDLGPPYAARVDGTWVRSDEVAFQYFVVAARH